MNKIKCHTVRTVPKFNRKIVERRTIDTLSTHRHDRTHFVNIKFCRLNDILMIQYNVYLRNGFIIYYNHIDGVMLSELPSSVVNLGSTHSQKLIIDSHYILLKFSSRDCNFQMGRFFLDLPIVQFGYSMCLSTIR